MKYAVTFPIIENIHTITLVIRILSNAVTLFLAQEMRDKNRNSNYA